MTALVDAAPLVALADADDPRRDATLEVLYSEPGSLIIPSPTTAEIDYLLGRRFGRAARRAFLADVASRRFAIGCLERDDYANLVDLEARYEGLDLGLADCALVVLAQRYQTTRLVTFDERHFRPVTSLGGEAFTLLPADA